MAGGGCCGCRFLLAPVGGPYDFIGAAQFAWVGLAGFRRGRGRRFLSRLNRFPFGNADRDLTSLRPVVGADNSIFGHEVNQASGSAITDA